MSSRGIAGAATVPACPSCPLDDLSVLQLSVVAEADIVAEEDIVAGAEGEEELAMARARKGRRRLPTRAQRYG